MLRRAQSLRPAAPAAALLLALSAPLAQAQNNDARDAADSEHAKQLATVTVNAQLDLARNRLSPSTGSSLYVFTRQAIASLPLGESTPLNQVLLQAPGVVQDSYGALHVRGDHGNLQYRIDGIILPESISGFGQTLDTRIINSVSLLTGALPAQYGLRSAGVISIDTRSGAKLGNGGSVGVTVGSRGTFEPTLSLHGQQGRWSWFFSGDYLKNDIGIENPTPADSAIHDKTWQGKGFGELSYLLDHATRISVLAGVTNSRFQIPDNPGQTPAYALAGVGAYPSAILNERQRELTRFAIVSLQGKLGSTDYQIASGQRYSQVDFSPDAIGDLIYNGVASTVGRSNRASTLQADFATPLGNRNTLRYGLYADFQRGLQDNTSLVFPADANGNPTSDVPVSITDDNRLLARTTSLYVQDQWSVTDQLTVNGGLRYDHVGGYLGESQLSPRLGLVYEISDDWTLHAGYARYFTPPATELIAATDIAKFQGTTNALPTDANTNVRAMRSNYYDAGVQWRPSEHLTLGLDAYLSQARNLLDEGQFGTALIFSDFNYRYGRNKGIEFTANWQRGPLRAYFNLASNSAKGKRVASGQYNFAADELAFIASHWIALDHAQRYTASGGASYRFGDGTTLNADYLFGTGLRAGFANTQTLPGYFQLNLGAARSFDVPGLGVIHTRLAVINALDRVYAIRDGSGIGVGAPQYGPRRGYYLGVSRDF
jgi:outer membrane receptor protein involved in Fe transport